MPQYAALTYTRDVDWSAPEQAEDMTAYLKFGQDHAAAIRGGAALYPTSTATTVRVSGARGGDVITSDGPYAETKEQLAGFIILEVPSIDTALEWAARCPGASIGAVEVRPLAPEAMRRGFTGE